LALFLNSFVQNSLLISDLYIGLKSSTYKPKSGLNIVSVVKNCSAFADYNFYT